MIFGQITLKYSFGPIIFSFETMNLACITYLKSPF